MGMAFVRTPPGCLKHAFGHDYDIVPRSMLVGFFIFLAAVGGLRVARKSPAAFSASS